MTVHIVLGIGEVGLDLILNNIQAHQEWKNKRINQPCEDTLALTVDASEKEWSALFTHEYGHPADDTKIA